MGDLGRFEQKVMPVTESGCHIWTACISRQGYGLYLVDGQSQRAHRVAWGLYRGPIPDGLHVLHKCDVRCCVNPDHLYLGSQQQNINDMVARKRHRVERGEQHYRAKLSEAQVVAIRRRAAAGERQKDIAAAFGIHRTSVRDIVRRRNWAWLD